MKAGKRVEALGRRIRGWLPGEPTVTSASGYGRTKMTASSLGLSLGVAFAGLLSALYITQWIYGVANNAIFVLEGEAALAAILYLAFSVRVLSYDLFPEAVLKFGRNLVLAVAIGFIFTITTSEFYNSGVNVLLMSGVPLRNELEILLTGVIPLWTSVAFFVVTVFSFDYARRSTKGPSHEFRQ